MKLKEIRYLGYLGIVSASIALWWGSETQPVQGQILPDATLPENTIVTPQGNNFTIEGGTTAGGNLFHSFGEFSVPTGTEAFFNNAARIDNIITRVTGGKISHIDGLIRANGRANLFLLNPHGIVFGPNGRLNIGGSFIGTTADRIQLDDGSFYSAKEPQGTPLLTVSVPLGLQFGPNPGTIRVQGSGHNLRLSETGGVADFAPFDRGLSNIGLSVGPGNTLALIGGPVELIGGAIASDGGRVELGSVAGGVVDLKSISEGWSFGYENISGFRDISLSRQALVDASGDRGSIQVRSRNMQLRDGAILLIQNEGANATGDILIVAEDLVELVGISADGEFRGGLFNYTLGDGASGDISITTGQLILREGSSISPITFGAGSSGNLRVNASQSVEIMGASLINQRLNSRLAILTTDGGDAGDVVITTQRLGVRDGGHVGTTTTGTGDSGNIIIQASDRVELLGFNRVNRNNLQASIINSNSMGAGDAGSISIHTERLFVLEGGVLVANSFAQGDAGSVEIDASREVVLANSSLPRRTAIASRTFIAPRFISSVYGVSGVPTGKGGSVSINTAILKMLGDTEISVRNGGTSDAGTLAIGANTILLSSGAQILAIAALGEGGDMLLNSQNLQLRGGSFISASAGGSGNGGNLNINTNTLVALEDSDISANAVEGAGGNIAISTRGIFLSPDSNITASSKFGVSGTVSISNPAVDPSSGLIELPKQVIDPGKQIVAGCAASEGNSLTITGRGGLPEDPTGIIRGNTLWRDRTDHTADPTTEKNVSRTDLIPRELPQTEDQIVEATGWVRHADGTIELVAQMPNLYYAKLRVDCPAYTGIRGDR